MLRGIELEVVTPGKIQKHSLAAALDPKTRKWFISWTAEE
jgi:hypothetical protein